MTQEGFSRTQRRNVLFLCSFNMLNSLLGMNYFHTTVMGVFSPMIVRAGSGRASKPSVLCSDHFGKLGIFCYHQQHPRYHYGSVGSFQIPTQ